MFYWVALNFVQGIGSIKYKALISHFKSPENVFKASTDELCQVAGIGEKLSESIKSFNAFKEVERELEKANHKGVKIINYLNYPSSLRNLEDSPPILYVKGDIIQEDENSFGIVGARSASIENLTFAEDIACRLASKGITIVSGMAVGIDSAAHKGALKAGGRTIAVLGSGVDIAYPYSNKGLYEKIAKHGAVISEFKMSAPPARENFPRRNRIISGLSKGLLVVEASADSGSLITADYAVKHGRKIFAVPGDIRKDKAKGTNNLIKKGAMLVDSEADILENITFEQHLLKQKTLNPDQINVTKNDLSGNELKVYKVIKEDAIHIDNIIKESALQASIVSESLLNLELRGYIKQFAGKMFLKVNNFSG